MDVGRWHARFVIKTIVQRSSPRLDAGGDLSAPGGHAPSSPRHTTRPERRPAARTPRGRALGHRPPSSCSSSAASEPEGGARDPGGSRATRVAVIGGGFAGVATAWHLLARARSGGSAPLHLDLYEAHGLGAGGSGAAAGLLHPYSPRGKVRRLRAVHARGACTGCSRRPAA